MPKRKAPADSQEEAPAREVGDPTLWKVGKPTTPKFYYDGAFPTHTLDKHNPDDDDHWAPELLDLSSAAIAKIVLSNLTGPARAKRWPTVFSEKGVRSTYTHKGRAAKVYDGKSKKWHYSVCFGNVQLHGAEGEKGGLNSKTRGEPNARHSLDSGAECTVQNDDEGAPEGATVKKKKKAARQSAKAPARKKASSSGTPKTPVVKQASSGATSNDAAKVQDSASVGGEADAAASEIKKEIEEEGFQDETAASKGESSRSTIPSSILGGGTSREDDLTLSREGTPRSKETASTKKRRLRTLPVKVIEDLKEDANKAVDLEGQVKEVNERNDKLAEQLKEANERNDDLTRQLKEAREKEEVLEGRLKEAGEQQAWSVFDRKGGFRGSPPENKKKLGDLGV